MVSWTRILVKRFFNVSAVAKEKKKENRKNENDNPHWRSFSCRVLHTFVSEFSRLFADRVLWPVFKDAPKGRLLSPLSHRYSRLRLLFYRYFILIVRRLTRVPHNDETLYMGGTASSLLVRHEPILLVFRRDIILIWSRSSFYSETVSGLGIRQGGKYI